MKLNPNDYHVVFNDDTNQLKLFDADGALLFQCEARNRAMNSTFGRWGRCPRGVFTLGKPRFLNPPQKAFGEVFIPVYGKAMQLFGRRGIGIHGGGTGLPDPFADEQGWQRTHGCIRCQNRQLRYLTSSLMGCKGTVYLTVSGK
jgi:hypothetical protein